MPPSDDDHPVALVVRGRGHVDDRTCRGSTRRSEPSAGGGPEGEDAAAGRGQPVALERGCAASARCRWWAIGSSSAGRSVVVVGRRDRRRGRGRRSDRSSWSWSWSAAPWSWSWSWWWSAARWSSWWSAAGSLVVVVVGGTVVVVVVGGTVVVVVGGTVVVVVVVVVVVGGTVVVVVVVPPPVPPPELPPSRAGSDGAADDGRATGAGVGLDGVEEGGSAGGRTPPGWDAPAEVAAEVRPRTPRC